MSGIVSGFERVAEALKLEARRLVPGAVRLVESEGDLELVVLLCQRHLVVGVHVTVFEDVRCFQRPPLLSERRIFKTCQVLP